jgi:hypothetical protein
MVKRIEVLQTECIFGSPCVKTCLGLPRSFAAEVTARWVSALFKAASATKVVPTFVPPARLSSKRLRQVHGYQAHVDGLDADKRDDDAAHAVDEQVVAQQDVGGLGLRT